MAASASPAVWEQVHEALTRAERDSPFYRAKLAAAGVHAAEIREPADLRRVPLTRKAEVPAAQQSAPPFGSLLAVAPERVASVSISPGPLYIPRTADEPTGVEALHESLRPHGRSRRRRRARHPLLPHHAGRPAYASRLRALRLPGDQRRHRQLRAAGADRQRARATVYVGTPSLPRQRSPTPRSSSDRPLATIGSASRPPRR